MKKTIKWVLGLILTLVMPCALMAETVNVGVNITEVPSIDVVVTLNTSLEVKVERQAAYDSFITITNNGTSLASVSITDIEALSEGAPTEFIEYDRNENPLKEANEAETASKIAFGVSLDSLNWTTVYPESENKPIELGVVDGSAYVGDVNGNVYDEMATYDFEQVGDKNYYSLFYEGTNVDLQKTFAIGVETGWAWTTEQNLEYAITLVVESSSVADSYHFPQEIFAYPYGSGNYDIVGDYKLKSDGSGITNDLNGLALRVTLYGELNINKIYMYYNVPATSTWFLGDLDLFEDVKMVEPISGNTHVYAELNSYAIDYFVEQDIHHIPLTIIGYACEDAENPNTGCTEVARWGHMYYLPTVELTN